MCPMCRRLIADHNEDEVDRCISALRNKPLWPFILIGGIGALVILYVAWLLVP